MPFSGGDFPGQPPLRHNTRPGLCVTRVETGPLCDTTQVEDNTVVTVWRNFTATARLVRGEIGSSAPRSPALRHDRRTVANGRRVCLLSRIVAHAARRADVGAE